MKSQHDLARDYRDTDNRDAESQLAYYEERIEAMTERIAELEAEVRQLRWHHDDKYSSSATDL